MDNKNKYYVYEWYDIETNYVFYVGKGNKRRYKDIWKRNKEWKYFYDNHQCNSRIVKYFDCEDTAYKYEYTLIQKYKKENQCIANIDQGGRPYGVALSDRNSQYGKPFIDRMDKKTLNQWIEKHKMLIGEKNPNYGNKKLSNKYKNNPLLSKQKQSRPRKQNGRAKKVNLYDNTYKFIRTFDCVVDCLEYIEKTYHIKCNNFTVYAKISENKTNNTKKTYKGFYIEYE